MAEPRARLALHWTAALPLVASLAFASCGGGHHGAASSTTTTSDAAPPSAASVSTKVVADYEAFWHAYLAAADPMDPESPLLRAHATGKELQQVASAFLARRSAGEVIKGTIDFDPVVTSVNGSSAVVRDCNFDHSVVVNVATGQTVGTADTVRQLVVANLQFDATANIWKVASTTHEGSGCTSAS